MDGLSKNRLDAFLRFVIDNDVSARELRQLVPALTGEPPREAEPAESPAQAVEGTPIPQIQSGQETKKLTVGMATYDDYDGVYFTLQAIRLYHPEILADVEFVIIN